LDIPIAGGPEQRIDDANSVGWVALVAKDYRGVQPQLRVEVGDRVRLGQPLFTDKSNPDVLFTSPGCGEVVTIHRGERRSLQSVVVRLEGDEEETFASHDRAALTKLDRQEVKEALLASGLWTSFRTRPLPIPSPGTHASSSVSVRRSSLTGWPSSAD
jgi:Na+-transporting NADH:ubiquinone oxidoreductase subunit A